MHNTDPFGEMSLGEMNGAMNTMFTLAMNTLRSEAMDLVFSKVGSAIIGSVPASGRSIGGNPGGAALVTTFAVMCRTTSKCLLKGIPLFSTGIDLPHHSIHIALATMHGGFTKSQASGALPFILARTPRHEVLNRKQKWPCKGLTGASTSLSCDEFPYATTLQGGELNWQADGVSLFPVSSWESSAQGDKLSAFYAGAKVKQAPSPESIFLNISIPAFPTFYIDRAGKVH